LGCLVCYHVEIPGGNKFDLVMILEDITHNCGTYQPFVCRDGRRQIIFDGEGFGLLAFCRGDFDILGLYCN